MRALRHVVVALLLSCMLAAQNSSAPTQTKQTEFAQIETRIPMPPTAFRGNGAWHLCYEIHLTNFSSAAYTIQDIAVTNESGATLLNVEGKSLAAVLYHPSRMPNEQPALAADLAPGEIIIAYMWIDIAQSAAIPTRLQHELKVRKSGENKSVDVQSASTTVATELPQIVPPLRGKSWVAVARPRTARLTGAPSSFMTASRISHSATRSIGYSSAPTIRPTRAIPRTIAAITVLGWRLTLSPTQPWSR